MPSGYEASRHCRLFTVMARILSLLGRRAPPTAAGRAPSTCGRARRSAPVASVVGLSPRRRRATLPHGQHRNAARHAFQPGETERHRSSGRVLAKRPDRSRGRLRCFASCPGFVHRAVPSRAQLHPARGDAGQGTDLHRDYLHLAGKSRRAGNPHRRITAREGSSC